MAFRDDADALLARNDALERDLVSLRAPVVRALYDVTPGNHPAAEL